ncbi:hypothetical protein SteCoe_10906 [Stentor coeruleus]|uniref:Tyrosine-protein kinase ephrin type A/B receptor-like domain-containing protein n=1 Tax=Stentor coeruleus TaxID=5963 RepID=A0A1R2CEE9_9CILI|nr:hypothetical protein SteCoe_10906 [Stentor coeruleus]
MVIFAVLYVNFICVHSGTIFSSIDIPLNGISPEPRTSSSLAVDSSGDKIYLFGGQSKRGFLNDLWIFSIKTSVWSLIYAQSYSPSPRSNSGGFFRKKTQEFCIFGGKSDISTFYDLWCFSLFDSGWDKIEFNDIPFSQMVKTRYLEYNETEFFIFATVDSFEIFAYIFDFNSELYEKFEINNYGRIKNNQKEIILEIQEDNKIILGNFDIKGNMNIHICYINGMNCINNTLSNSDIIDSGFIIESTLVDNNLLVFMSHGHMLNISLTSNISNISYLNSPNIPENSGVSSYKNNFYTFGGISKNTLDNTLTLYKIIPESKITYKILSKYQLFPPLRLRSALMTVRNKIYLFGGLSNFGFLNDFWVYDPSLEKWDEVFSKNDPPSPRHSFAYSSTGDIIVIWGGITEKGYSNDFFIYNVVTKSWYTLYGSSNLHPSKRFGACLVIDYPYFYIGGGVDELGFCNDLWVFDIATGVYKKTNAKIEKAYSYCYKQEKNILYMFGESQTTNATQHFTKNFYGLDNWGPIAQKFINGFLVISGSTNSGNLMNNIIYSNKGSQIAGRFSDYICNSMYTFYNHSIYYFSGSYYTSYFKVFHSLPRAKFARFDLRQIFQNANLSFDCSTGFIPYNFGCKICPVGYYSNENFCIPCKKGHFNPIPGASSSRQCYPCPEGTFNDKEGSSMCKLCLKGYYCYAGSPLPEIISAKTKEENNPKIVINEIGSPKKIEVIINHSGIILVFIIIFIFLLSPKVKKYIAGWDLYPECHNYKEDDKLYVHKNSIGGIFTAIFYISFACICINVLCKFFLENKNLEQSLMPLILFSTMIEKFSANFEIIVGVKNYADICVSPNFTITTFSKESNFSNCAPNIILNYNNLKRQKVVIKCKLENNRFCLVKISCQGCEVESSSIINLLLQGEFSYGAGITLNLTSESSIPNYYSTVYSEIFPNKNSIFLGSLPNIFTYLVIPSIYLSSIESESYIQTGYHVQELSIPVKGSEKSVEDLFLFDQLAIKIVLKKYSLGLFTEIKKERSIFSLFGVLFGIFIGLLGVVCFFMRRVESINLNRKSEKLKKSIKSVTRLRLHFDNIFKDVGLNTQHEDCEIRYSHSRYNSQDFTVMRVLENSE